MESAFSCLSIDVSLATGSKASLIARSGGSNAGGAARVVVEVGSGKKKEEVEVVERTCSVLR